MRKYRADAYCLAALCFLLLAIQVTGWGLQYMVCQGDHGRTLYFAWQVLKGQIPYVDFNWYYGPLMLYYFAFWFKCLGLSIATAKTAWSILYCLTALALYTGSRRFLTPLYALAGSLAFAVIYPTWFHSYNHIGATFLMTVSLCLLPELALGEPGWRWWALALLIGLTALVKFNIGLSFAAAAGMTLCIAQFTLPEKHWGALAIWSAACLASIVFLYGLWLVLAPLQHFPRWFPIPGNRLAVYTPDLFSVTFAIRYHGLTSLLHPYTWFSTLVPLFSVSVLAASVPYLAWRIYLDKLQGNLLFLHLVGISFFSAHEFWLIHTPYSLLYFSWPFVCTLVFYSLQEIKSRSTLKTALLGISLITILSLGIALCSWQKRVTRYPVSLERAQISVGDENWAYVVENTVEYIRQNTEKGEYILVLPHDQIYYFLADRERPTREDFFTPKNLITPAEEEEIIADLVAKDVRYIFLSNHLHKPLDYDGGFGRINCRNLVRYIDHNYNPVGTVGPWGHVPGWISYHGIKIFKKKSSGNEFGK